MDNDVNFRNPVYNHIGGIDVEIEHPIYGWIPHSVAPGSQNVATIEAVGPVAPYVAPPPKVVTAQEVHLEPYQFHAMLKISGMENLVRQTITGLTDPRERSLAEAKFEKAHFYNRADPLVIALSAQAGLTAQEVDTMWLEASKL